MSKYMPPSRVYHEMLQQMKRYQHGLKVGTHVYYTPPGSKQQLIVRKDRLEAAMAKQVLAENSELLQNLAKGPENEN